MGTSQISNGSGRRQEMGCKYEMSFPLWHGTSKGRFSRGIITFSAIHDDMLSKRGVAECNPRRKEAYQNNVGDGSDADA